MRWFRLHYLSVEFEAGCCHLGRDVVCKIPEVQTTKGTTLRKMEQESSSPGKKTQTHKNRKTNPVLLNSQASLGREIETCLAKAGWRLRD